MSKSRRVEAFVNVYPPTERRHQVAWNTRREAFLAGDPTVVRVAHLVEESPITRAERRFMTAVKRASRYARISEQRIVVFNAYADLQRARAKGKAKR